MLPDSMLSHTDVKTLLSLAIMVWMSGIFADLVCPAWPPVSAMLPPISTATSAPTSEGRSNQAETGQEIYQRACARCHGPIDGDGITAPGLIGAEAAKKLAAFRTAQGLFTFIRYSMPQDMPGSLPEAEYWAVLTFLLVRNDFIEADASVDATTAEHTLLQR